MRLETLIRLCDYLNISSSENQSDLLGWTIVNTKKALFIVTGKQIGRAHV